MSGESTGNAPEHVKIPQTESAGAEENVAMRGDVLSMPALAGAFDAMKSTNTTQAEKAMEENGFPTADLFKEFLNQAEQINAAEKSPETTSAANKMPVPIEDSGASTFDASPEPAKEEQSRLI